MLNSHFYTTFYSEKKADRLKELLSCLHNNLSNRFITSVTVFNEGGDLSMFNSSKLKVISIKERPIYQDFFNYINQQDNDTDIHIIANTDIYFDEQIAVLNHLDLEKKVLTLARWDTTEGNRTILYNRNDSQDVWIFKGRIKSDLKADFPLGVPRCDNRLLYELQNSGYLVLNPAFSIKAYHIHKGQRALVYTEADNIYKIASPYRYLYPHNYFGFWQTLAFNATHQAKLGDYRYDIKKINRWLIIRFIRKAIKVLTKFRFPLIGYK